MHYTVLWTIDVEADSPEEAAREAMRTKNKIDQDRIDNQFYVVPERDQWKIDAVLSDVESIDLDAIDGRL